MVVVANSVYAGGALAESPGSLAATYDLLRQGGRTAWIAIDDPDDDEIHSLAKAFDFHELLIEDMLTGHQRPKIERYENAVFVVLTTAIYVDAADQVEFGELHVVLGADYAITVRRARTPDLTAARTRFEGDRDLLALGPRAALYVVLDLIVDDYAPVIDGLDNDIDEIEAALFGGQESAQRIYALSSEVIRLQRATRPLLGILDTLSRRADDYGIREDLQAYLRDVNDHAIHVVERADTFRSLLDNALSVNLALVGQAQNETSLAQNDQMKRISSWAAIFFAPSLIAGIYGMNFTHMPAIIHSPWGFPLSLAQMVAGAGLLFLIFKRNKWL